MTQGTFQSFTDPNSPNYKSPEERKLYIEEQIAKGNPKYIERNAWLKENADKIRITKLEEQVSLILAKLPK